MATETSNSSILIAVVALAVIAYLAVKLNNEEKLEATTQAQLVSTQNQLYQAQAALNAKGSGGGGGGGSNLSKIVNGVGAVASIFSFL